MEDYDVFNEMQNIKTIIMGIDITNEKFWEDNILENQALEFMPIRLNYDLDGFSKEYIEKTKKLFIYYYNKNNVYNNELLRIKKHFKHYQRYPQVAFIPNEEEYYNLRKLIIDVGIIIFDNEDSLLNFIRNIKD